MNDFLTKPITLTIEKRKRTGTHMVIEWFENQTALARWLDHYEFVRYRVLIHKDGHYPYQLNAEVKD